MTGFTLVLFVFSPSVVRAETESDIWAQIRILEAQIVTLKERLSVLRPTNVQDLQATVAGNTVVLTWTKPQNHASYDLYRSTDAYVPLLPDYRTVALRYQLDANATSYTDATTKPSVRYYYKLFPLSTDHLRTRSNTNGTSNIASAIRPVPTGQALSVENFTAVREGNNVRLRWSSASIDENASAQVVIYRRQFSGVPQWTNGIHVDRTANTYLDTGANFIDGAPRSNQTYYYTIIVEAPTNDFHNSPLRQTSVGPTNTFTSSPSLRITADVVALANNSSIVGGAASQNMAAFKLDASLSNTDIAISDVYPALNATIPAASITNCRFDDSDGRSLMSGSRIVNPINATGASIPFSFDYLLTIPKGTIKTIILKCTIASGSSGTARWSLSGIAYSPLSSTSVPLPSGQTVTISSGGLTIGTTLNTTLIDVAAGSQNVPMATFAVSAYNEDMRMTKMAFVFTAGAPSDLVSASLYDGSTKLGDLMWLSSTTALVVLNSSPLIIKNTTLALQLRATMSSSSSVIGHRVAINWNGADTQNTQAYGAVTGIAIHVTGATTGAQGVRIN